MKSTSIFAFVFVLASIVIWPVALGILASKRRTSVPVLVTMVIIGILIGLIAGPGVIWMGADWYLSVQAIAIIIGTVLLLGIAMLISVLCMKRVPQTEAKVTLPMPLPPGYQD